MSIQTSKTFKSILQIAKSLPSVKGYRNLKIGQLGTSAISSEHPQSIILCGRLHQYDPITITVNEVDDSLVIVVESHSEVFLRLMELRNIEVKSTNKRTFRGDGDEKSLDLILSMFNLSDEIVLKTEELFSPKIPYEEILAKRRARNKEQQRKEPFLQTFGGYVGVAVLIAATYFFWKRK